MSTAPNTNQDDVCNLGVFAYLEGFEDAVADAMKDASAIAAEIESESAAESAARWVLNDLNSLAMADAEDAYTLAGDIRHKTIISQGFSRTRAQAQLWVDVRESLTRMAADIDEVLGGGFGNSPVDSSAQPWLRYRVSITSGEVAQLLKEVTV